MYNHIGGRVKKIILAPTFQFENRRAIVCHWKKSYNFPRCSQDLSADEIQKQEKQNMSSPAYRCHPSKSKYLSDVINAVCHRRRSYQELASFYLSRVHRFEEAPQLQGRKTRNEMQSGQGWATQNDRHVINQAITLIECDWMRKKKGGRRRCQRNCYRYGT